MQEARRHRHVCLATTYDKSTSYALDLRSRDRMRERPWKPPDVTTIAAEHLSFESAENERVRDKSAENRLQARSALTR